MAKKDKTKSGSDIMLDILFESDVEMCWGHPGGAILPFYDAMYRSKMKHFLMRHEQGAVHAAEGFAKATGKIGVCVATSGPGATNLMTGIADANSDSVPVLAITGQVPTTAIGSDAFQEVDTYGMSISITKYNALLKHADDVARVTKEAITIALAKRPGPVLIDFPKDVQLQESTNLTPVAFNFHENHYKDTEISGDIDKLITAINRSQKPLLYVGGGAITSAADQVLLKLAEKAQIPVVSTLMALGAFPGTHDLSLGMMGMHGTAYANKAVMECDLIIALAARFDDRVAGDAKNFAHQAIRAQVDIDASEFDKRVNVDIHVNGNLKAVLEAILPDIREIENRAWVDYIKELKEENPLRFNLSKDLIKPQFVIAELYKKTRGKAIISTDVGQHQMWSAQYYPFDEPRRWLTSGGLGTMGFGFPAAIGAKQGCPNEDVYAISGDGSFQMCMQELAMIRMYNVPVKILLFNNGFLGMVRQWQELFYDNRFAESNMNYNPDFVKICSGYDITARRIVNPSEIDSGLDFLINTDDCCLLEVAIPEEEKVYPMIASGAKYEQMIDFDHSSEQGEEFTLVPNKKDSRA